MEVGQSIKKIREWKNYSQKYMADELNTTQQTYSRYETGEIEMTLNKLKKIAEILEVPVNYILDLDEKAIFTSYNVENGGEGNHNHFTNLSGNPELLKEFKEQYEKRIEELKEENKVRIEEIKIQFNIHIDDLKKEVEYLKSILDKTLKG